MQEHRPRLLLLPLFYQVQNSGTYMIIPRRPEEYQLSPLVTDKRRPEEGIRQLAATIFNLRMEQIEPPPQAVLLWGSEDAAVYACSPVQLPLGPIGNSQWYPTSVRSFTRESMLDSYYHTPSSIYLEVQDIFCKTIPHAQEAINEIAECC